MVRIITSLTTNPDLLDECNITISNRFHNVFTVTGTAVANSGCDKQILYGALMSINFRYTLI